MKSTAGNVVVEMPYCQLADGGGWVSPLRKEWGLEPSQTMTPELEERLAFTAARTSSYESAAEVAACWGAPAGADDSTIHRHVQKAGTRSREAEKQRERDSQIPAKREEIVRRAGAQHHKGTFSLIIMVDGWMARERGADWGLRPAEAPGSRVAWHETKTAIILRVEDRAKTASGRPLVLEKAVVAHQGEWDGLAKKLSAEALRRGLEQAKEVFFVADGGTWIWKLKAERFARAVGVLDFFHASQHLWAAGQALLGKEGDAARKWVLALLHKLRHGEERKALRTIKGLETKAASLNEESRRIVTNAIGYFHDHRSHVHYSAAAARGCPVGSGAMESTCAQLQGRFKCPGQFWTEQGKTNLMSVELARRNGDWPEIWNYRPEQM